MRKPTNDYYDPILPDWQSFIADRQYSGTVSPNIAESWQRCKAAKVNPLDSNPHRKLTNPVLTERLAKKAELIRIAKPFMANLYQFVRGSGFVVVLADEQGYILELLGDKDVLDNPLTQNFFAGASWREEDVGTNAIGTTVVINSPIQVSGVEHYCSQHHNLTCSAAPIFDKNRQLIGILDMSGASYKSHQHTLGMVAAAAEAVMAQLDIRSKNRELALANNRLTNIFNTMSDGVLMVDGKGCVTHLNPAAKEILRRSEDEITGLSIDRILGGKSTKANRLYSAEPYEDIEIMIDAKNSTIHCLATGEPLSDDLGRIIGTVIILRPIKHIQTLVNRYSGLNAALQFSDIIGESTEILETIRIASLAATTSSNILLQGESGTGKEIFAQAIHNKSEQRNGLFVALNCGVIPRELIGSELFGYVEGAFTGAKKGGKPGKFELASGGTLFLDEIGDMPLEQQVALLRVLQEKCVTRIGSDKVIPVNVRVICATNKNLLAEVEKGAFRQDLFYRLNVISLTLPPLRNRPQDIPLLFRHYLDKIGQDRQRKFRVEPEVIRCLQNFDWPGNVRELQNIAERTVSLAESEIITLAQLPPEIYSPLKHLAPLPQPAIQTAGDATSRRQRRLLLQSNERMQIDMMLTKHGGNVSAVARELSVTRNTLYRKMRQYNIEN